MNDNPYICPYCGQITNAKTVFFDSSGWHTSCVYCDTSFEIAIEEITTDKESVLIKMPQKQFIELVQAMDSSLTKCIDFYDDANDGICYGVMYTNFLDNVILGIGGYSQNTRTLDVDGMWDDTYKSYIGDFVKEYLENENFGFVYVDADNVDFKKWDDETFNLKGEN